MKKVLITFALLGLIIQSTVFAQNAICGIGANLVQDPYNKKVFVFKTYQNSMAIKCGLPEGAEIISVDDQKVKKLNINQVTELIRGEEGTKVKLVIKYNKEESIIEIPRAKFILPEKVQDKFEIHWKQIAPINTRIEPIPQNMINNMSKKMVCRSSAFHKLLACKKS